MTIPVPVWKVRRGILGPLAQLDARGVLPPIGRHGFRVTDDDGHPSLHLLGTDTWTGGNRLGPFSHERFEELHYVHLKALR